MLPEGGPVVRAMAERLLLDGTLSGWQPDFQSLIA
jgi:hypothetical protein